CWPTTVGLRPTNAKRITNNDSFAMFRDKLIVSRVINYYEIADLPQPWGPLSCESESWSTRINERLHGKLPQLHQAFVRAKTARELCAEPPRSAARAYDCRLIIQRSRPRELLRLRWEPAGPFADRR